MIQAQTPSSVALTNTAILLLDWSRVGISSIVDLYTSQICLRNSGDTIFRLQNLSDVSHPSIGPLFI